MVAGSSIVLSLRVKARLMMKSATANNPSKNVTAANSLRPNNVDRTFSLLLSSVVMVGLGVLVLGLLFVLSRTPDNAPGRIVTPYGGGRHDVNSDGFAQDFDPPSNDEAQTLAEPSLEQTLQSVSSTVSSVLASLESIDSGTNNGGNGSSNGYHRQRGNNGGGREPINRFERWELKFTARDKRSYAKQLDFFHIELAAIGGGHSTIDYASHLTSSPHKRSGDGQSENRLYFMYRNQGALAQYDRALLRAADIQTDNRVMLKFIPKETEEQLALAEAAYYLQKRSGELKVSEIAKTVFECRPNSKGDGFEWVVIAQTYFGARP